MLHAEPPLPQRGRRGACEADRCRGDHAVGDHGAETIREHVRRGGFAHRSGAKRSMVGPMTPEPPNDTSPEVERILIEGYRRMSPAQKLARVQALTQAVQELALLDVRRRHPNADERELALRVASRWLEPDLMLRALGWDVREAGY